MKKFIKNSLAVIGLMASLANLPALTVVYQTTNVTGGSIYKGAAFVKSITVTCVAGTLGANPTFFFFDGNSNSSATFNFGAFTNIRATQSVFTLTYTNPYGWINTNQYTNISYTTNGISAGTTNFAQLWVGIINSNTTVTIPLNKIITMGLYETNSVAASSNHTIVVDLLPFQ